MPSRELGSMDICVGADDTLPHFDLGDGVDGMVSSRAIFFL